MVFLGNAPWSVPPLEAIARSNHDLVRVLTHSPRPAGRGNVPRATAVADAARADALPLIEIESIRDEIAVPALETAQPDVLVVVAFGEILPPTVLELPRIAAVNLHFSLLPELRGADPVRAAILDGHRETGVSTIWMDEGLDTGDVLLQERVAIAPDDDTSTLGTRLAQVGGEVLVQTLDALAEGTAERAPQDGRLATVAPKLTPEDRRLRWSEDAASLERRVRALAPEPGALTAFRGRSLKVHRAAATSDEARADPGAILSSEDGLLVATGDGELMLLEVSPEGKRRMTAAAFARGARPTPGERMD
ncbi:MAG: methionyl-tRNA formyltransferase [Actinomycetota bacterium]